MKLAVLDFDGVGARVTSLAFSDLGMACSIIPKDIRVEELAGRAFSDVVGIILPTSDVDVRKCFDWGILRCGIPVLGICHGHQLIGRYLGGDVDDGAPALETIETLDVVGRSRLLRGLPRVQHVYMDHLWQVVQVRPRNARIAGTETCSHPVIEDRQHALYGVQFHPENFGDTEHGRAILQNFLLCCMSHDRRVLIQSVGWAALTGRGLRGFVQNVR